MKKYFKKLKRNKQKNGGKGIDQICQVLRYIVTRHVPKLK